MLRGFDPVASGIQRCPFLSDLAANEGEGFARSIATNPWQPAERGARQPIFQEVEDFSRVFKVFHGPEGIVPLAKKEGRLQEGVSEEGVHESGHSQEGDLTRSKRPLRSVAAPAASLSLSNFGFLGDFFNQSGKQQRKPKEKGKQRGKKSNASSGAQGGPMQLSSASGGTGGQCPLRKYFGPLATMVMTGKYKCPPAIVYMRSVMSKTELVRTLRPEALPVKILAVMAVSSALNIPFGALREHCKKFSPEWFLVVHATIPFIAMFRKTVIMPKYAMAFTIAAAIGGQMAGARLERKRIQMAENWKQKSDSGQTCGLRDFWDTGAVGEGNNSTGKLYCAPQASLTDSTVKMTRHRGATAVQ